MQQPARDSSARGAARSSAVHPAVLLDEPIIPIAGYSGVLLNETTRLSLQMLAESDGQLPHAVHKRRVCGERFVSAPTFDRLYRTLVEGALVARLPAEGDRRRRIDLLTPRARELLDVGRHIEAVERWATPRLRAPTTGA